MTDSDKNRRCMELLGWEVAYIESAYPFDEVRRKDGKSRIGVYDYGADQALLGEMLAWFREHDLNIQLLYTVHGCKIDVLDWAYDLQHSHDGETPSIAVRDALIAAGGEHE